ncbi:MAG: mycothiol conjugate amidase Mca [Acidimicrobiia bacterium]|nr:mycothiol conjugate amidase Mca [Acidimicrobiia bacterium]
MMSPHCVLTVHAHPDDEASKGAGTIARCHAEGIRTVLVCCTGGEVGDILNKAMDTPEVRADLPGVRRAELAAAADLIGYDEVVMLGYRDSGMPDSEANAHPDCFARADFDEAVDRLVAIIRRARPQVIVTYSDDQRGYQHPDHLRVHDISLPAFDLAGDPDHRPDLGPAWEPLKLYYTQWSRARIEARHKAFLDQGLDSPYDDFWFKRPSQDDRITTRVDVSDYYEARVAGLRAHATQVDPESPFWFGLPADIDRAAYPYDDYVLARSRVSSSTPESDLFAGISEPASATR